jgi:hypothetical protein
MSTFLAIIVALILGLTFVGLFILIVRLIVRPSANEPRLLQTADGGFTVVGKQVTCEHCGGSKFNAREILLNTWVLSLLRIDWLDSSATVLSCATCGRITWFSQEKPAGPDQ